MLSGRSLFRFYLGFIFAVLFLLLSYLPAKAVEVDVANAVELRDAIDNASNGDIIHVAPGTYVLDSTVYIKSSISIIGSGVDKTFLRAAPDWHSDFSAVKFVNKTADFLLKIEFGVHDVSISNINFEAPNIYGAIFGAYKNYRLEVSHCYFGPFMWTGMEIHSNYQMKIHDNEFHDAGGQDRAHHISKTSGSMWLHFPRDSEIWNNKMTLSPGSTRKLRSLRAEGIYRTRIHHNEFLIPNSFSLESPHENDNDNEIDHNVVANTISIPKEKSLILEEGRYSYHIHHNLMLKSYSIELPRNSVKIDHNLFDFNPNDDRGNVVAIFPGPSHQDTGPMFFEDNLVKNVGRRVVWHDPIYNNVTIRNNHIKNGPKGPNNITNGNFYSKYSADLSTITIKNNIIESLLENPRKVFEGNHHYGAVVFENNSLINMLDADLVVNPVTGEPQGPRDPIQFGAGVNGRYTVDEWAWYAPDVDLTLTNNTVDENSSKGTVIGEISVDALKSPESSYSYEIVAVDGNSSDLFIVDGNELKLNGPVDYESNQSFVVTVKVKNSVSDNAFYEKELNITVNDLLENLAPIPVISIAKIDFTTVTFNATASMDLDGSIVAYDWDFGDSNTSIEINPTHTHTYIESGTYIAALTVTDDMGEQATVSTSVVVEKDPTVYSVADLIEAVNNGKEGDLIRIAPGTYELESRLLPKKNMKIIGAGMDQTVIKAAPSWAVDMSDLPFPSDSARRSDQCVNRNANACIDREAYLIYVGWKVTNVEIAEMKLTAPSLHGAIAARNADGLDLHHLHIEDVLWSAFRSVAMNGIKVHDCVFVDAAGRKSWTSGAIYATWIGGNSEIWNNKIYSTDTSGDKYFGIKGYEGKGVHIHHNEIDTGSFSVEFPHNNDRDMEIDHNWFKGPISVPKHAGGSVSGTDLTYRIHHNWLQRSYAIELARNSIEIDHNLFDFKTSDDGGNLMADFGSQHIVGPLFFHDNLIKNPGRGIAWVKGNGRKDKYTGETIHATYENFYFYNNHIKANTTTRASGFFDFDYRSDFSTIEIKNNIIENTEDLVRPLFRTKSAHAALVENNSFENVCRIFDAGHVNGKWTIIQCDDYNEVGDENLDTGAPRGPLEPLFFTVGVDDRYTVDSWSAYPTGISVSLTQTNVDEDAGLNTVIGKLDVETDLAGEYSFEISSIDGIEGSDLFIVDGDNLVLNGLLDFETKSSHLITVHITNNLGVKFDKEFTIQVNDESEEFEGVHQGFAAQWNFDNVSGSTVTNLLGDSHAGTLITGTALVDTISGKGLMLDGTKNKGMKLPGLDYEATTVTVSAWIKPMGRKLRESIIAQDTGRGSLILLDLMYDKVNDELRPRFRFKRGSKGHNSRFIKAPVGSSVEFSKWSHVAATYDGSKVQIYINGEAVFAEDDISNAISGDLFKNPDVDIIVGGDAKRAFNGLLDDVAIFEEALDHEQIKKLLYDKHATKAEQLNTNNIDHFAHAWNFENYDSELGVEDITDANRPGTLLANAAIVSSGNDSALSLGGRSDRMQVGAMNYENNQVSLLASIVPSSTRKGFIFNQSSGAANHDLIVALQTFFHKNRTIIRFELNLNGTYKRFSYAHVGDESPIGKEMHIAATFDGGEVRIYIDGKLKYTRIAFGQLSNPEGVPMEIGGSTHSLSGFIGSIDDVGIYGKALSENEIKALKNP